MARGLFLAAALAVAFLAGAQANGIPGLPPLVFPNITQPNATALMEGVRNTIRSSVQSAVMERVAYKPILCPNRKPFVVCHWDVCKSGNSTCKANQVCVPDYCGRCGAKCVDIALPPVDLKAPAIPKFLQGQVSLPTPKATLPCGLNQAINITGTASNLKAKQLTFACKSCPEGTVSNGLAVACTVCPPGTYANRTEGKCKSCEPGTYNRGLGATACKPCEKGSFAPIWASLVCVKCPFGFSAPAPGAKSCKWTGFSS